MTIPVSTVPSVRAYLKTAITSLVNDNAVLVCNGDPGTNSPDDLIAITDVQRQSMASALVGNGGAHSIDETYTVQVVVSCYRGGDSTDTVDLRAWALASTVETAVRNDLSLGGRVIVARPSGSQSAGPQWDDDHKGVVCDVFVHITVTTQL